MMKIAFLESFYGGSYRYFADSFAETFHGTELFTMPPRFWRWRMRGAAPYFARRMETPASFDLILVSSLINAAELRGILQRMKKTVPPIILYFHENQLSYPPGDGAQDIQDGFSNIMGAYAADGVIFNSLYHRDEFFRYSADLLGKMPDCGVADMLPEIQSRTTVLYPGICDDDWQHLKNAPDKPGAAGIPVSMILLKSWKQN